MNVRNPILRQLIFTSALVLAALCPVHAQQDWKATVGGQSADMSRQAVAFLPNEIWIYAGDSITWTFGSGDIHTVTFLTTGQVYPFDQGPVAPPTRFRITFTAPGAYSYVCAFHDNLGMEGQIIVLP